MRLLILGGTQFLGRAVARLAHAAGHDVTCLARGQGGEPVPEVRFVAADRDAPGWLSGLDGERFDAAVDVTRRPSHARRAAQALAGRVGHWGYVSSVSVYADLATPGQLAGTAPLLPPAPPEVDDPTGEHLEHYGGCKVSCEQAVRDTFGDDRSFICRAGLIVGPEDPSGRFTYWVDRLARGGRVLAPGNPQDPVQLVDVRDLASWLVRAAEQGLTGTYDATSAPMPRGRCLAEVAAGVRSEATLTWTDQAFLQAQEVRPWSGERSVPLWVPLPEYAGFLAHDVGPALAAGLTIRPLTETAAATLDWLTSDHGAAPLTGLTSAEEAELLRRWDAAG
ncbi:MAG: NAD-dependent epimerase/dehydratase family protein [Micromonosporaceae bacterium]|nr:NAD-dependent epimerase/dehydratase family protein [Micromonosporaceae bacterium]